MTWPVRFTPLATEDLAEAYTDFETARRGLGEEFLGVVADAVSLIGSFPEACPKVHRELRRALLNRFPYAGVGSRRTTLGCWSIARTSGRLIM